MTSAMGATGNKGPEGPRVKTLRAQEKWNEPQQSFFLGNTGTADAMLTTTNASTAVYTSAASILSN